MLTVEFSPSTSYLLINTSTVWPCCWNFADIEGKTLHQPVIRSVMAKLKTSVLYGVFSIDLFCKMTISKRQLLMMASDPMTPNIMLRPVVILPLNSLQPLPFVVKNGFSNGWPCICLSRCICFCCSLYYTLSCLQYDQSGIVLFLGNEYVFIYTSKTSVGWFINLFSPKVGLVLKISLACIFFRHFNSHRRVTGCSFIYALFT